MHKARRAPKAKRDLPARRVRPDQLVHQVSAVQKGRLGRLVRKAFKVRPAADCASWLARRPLTVRLTKRWCRLSAGLAHRMELNVHQP